jgi:hypothetical protein
MPSDPYEPPNRAGETQRREATPGRVLSLAVAALLLTL